MLSEGSLRVGCAPKVLGLAQHPEGLTGACRILFGMGAAWWDPTGVA